MAVLLFVGVFGFVFFSFDKFGDVKRSVKYVLKDPSSAMFRNITKSTKNSNIYCGEVNARNSSNGYTGFHSFIYDRSLSQVIVMNRYSSEPGKMLEGLKYFETGQCTGPYLD